MSWNSDEELFELMRSRLYSPVIGDVLDALGRYHQFLPRDVRPLLPEMKLAGRAMPVLMADVHGPQRKPFGLLTEALDQLAGGEIYVGSLPSQACACWGEVLTATAKMRGSLGAVVNGPHRDTPMVLAQDWPVFSTGAFAQDSAPRMAVIDFRCTIEIGGTTVRPGDLIFGDRDGVVIVPRELEQQVIGDALKKASAEKTVRAAIENGMSSTDAFEKYGVL
jgi:regulator of RNase E activity RraA